MQEFLKMLYVKVAIIFNFCGKVNILEVAWYGQKRG